MDLKQWSQIKDKGHTWNTTGVKQAMEKRDIWMDAVTKDKPVAGITEEKQ